MKNYLNSLFVILIFAVLFTGCGDKFELPNTGGEGNVSGDTLYIPTGLPWSGFNNPQAMLMGREPFLYVCDTDNNRIVMLDIAGQFHGSLSIKHPVAISQDYRLNLLVCAEFDTNGISYSAVYKIDLFAANHQIENAIVTRVLPLRDADYNLQRKYTAITAFYDNSFYVARTGPNNTSVSNPDNSIFKLAPVKLNAGGDIIVPSDGDSLTIERVPFIDPVSHGLISANGINCMTAFNKRNTDFIATLSGDNSFKAQWFHFYSSGIEEKYISQFTPGTDAVSFVKPNRFSSPVGNCLDPSGNIYIADAEKDSIFKFNSSGNEMHSFGGQQYFSSPSAVAYFDKILYVLDASKNQILRFKLSTDQ